MAKTTAIEVGLTPDQEDQVWSAYEACGNMAEVAKALGFPYHRVRQAIHRDHIRLYDVNRVRSEAQATMWEEKESRSAKLSGELLDVIQGMVNHIKSCIKEGEPLTDLVNTRALPVMDAATGKPKLNADEQPILPRMTPTQAFQWLLETKQLDAVSKLAMTAAKIAVGLRQFSAMEPEARRGISDPSKMSDEEIVRMIRDIEKVPGRELPWAVRQWAEAHALPSELGKAS